MTDLVEFLRARYDEDRAWADNPECAEDPARVLREVESKRRIVDEYEALTRDFQHADETVVEHTRRAAFEDVLELLALPHADHPGYRAEWRP